MIPTLSLATLTPRRIYPYIHSPNLTEPFNEMLKYGTYDPFNAMESPAMIVAIVVSSLLVACASCCVICFACRGRARRRERRRVRRWP